MAKNYERLSCSKLDVELENGFLAASKEDAINDDTVVTIDKQVGGDTIEFTEWE